MITSTIMTMGIRRNGDYLAVRDDKVDDLEPVMTVVGGTIVFDAAAK